MKLIWDHYQEEVEVVEEEDTIQEKKRFRISSRLLRQ
jgi:hypothetical protein